MTDTVRSTKEKASAATGALGGLAGGEVADRLKSEVQDYLGAKAQSLLTSVGRRLGKSTALLEDMAQGKGPGLAGLAAGTGKRLAQGKGRVRSVVESGAGQLKGTVTDKVKGGLGGGKDGGGKGEGKDRDEKSAGGNPTLIMESLDIGVPRRTAYDQWTQFQEFSTFAKGVKSVRRTDDAESEWQAKIFLSTRGWKARITEQVPDDRIAWTSEGDKGTTSGVVSFHELGPSLTRVLLVLEYQPQGFVEKTGNLWRAQGRRARLDLKLFARFVTVRGEATDAWRGEIRDGEVVVSHEDAVAKEQEQQGDEGDEEPTDGGGPEDSAASEAPEPDEDEEHDGEPGASDEEPDEPEGEHDDEEPGGPAEDETYEDETNAGYEEAEPEDESLER